MKFRKIFLTALILPLPLLAADAANHFALAERRARF